MKIPSTLDLILWGIVALAAAGLLFTVNHWRTQAAEFKVAKVEWKRTLAAKDHLLAIERNNTRKANEASTTYQGRLRDLELDRTAHGFGDIRVCRRPVFRMPATGAASGGSNAAPVQSDAGAVEMSADVGPAASVFGSRCEANWIQLEELQNWVRNR